jgi:spore coat polysaccharide biosynthesis predicted glycosyltransferase SpsG
LKIAFRIDIGNEIGTGHYLRMSALADAFSGLGHQCAFFKSEDEPIDYSPFDIIVVDTYQVNDDYIASLNSPDRLLVCYDDNALYTYNCDILINANLHAHELSFRFGEKIPRLLLGGKYALLRGEFRNAAPVSILENANRVFICFGGSDLRNMTRKVIDALIEIDGIQLCVVMGPYTKNDKEVFALANENVTIFKAPASISEIMKSCDIAVTAAGSMIYELAAIGLPALTITQADNQLLIAEYMDRNDLMTCVGNWENIDFNKLRYEVVSLLSDFSTRKLKSAQLLETVDKNGAINAAQEIIHA